MGIWSDSEAGSHGSHVCSPLHASAGICRPLQHEFWPLCRIFHAHPTRIMQLNKAVIPSNFGFYTYLISTLYQYIEDVVVVYAFCVKNESFSTSKNNFCPN